MYDAPLGLAITPVPACRYSNRIPQADSWFDWPAKLAAYQAAIDMDVPFDASVDVTDAC